MSEDPDFKYIIRIANADVSGEEKLAYALTSIRGIGQRTSSAIIIKLGLDSTQLAGKLTDKNVEEIEAAIGNISEYVPKRLRYGRRCSPS
jgi:ribosomal protein S13